MIKITKWNETFENADSRKRQRLGFFYAPSGCDSSGYLSLMSEFPQEEALMALGVFMALCQQSATMKKGVRGSFVKSDGAPMSEKQISMLIHVDACHLRAAVKVLADERVKWLEIVGTASGVPVICQSSASGVPVNAEFVQGEGEGEGEEKVKKGTAPSELDRAAKEKEESIKASKKKALAEEKERDLRRAFEFEEFWAAYPSGKRKAPAKAKWMSKKNCESRPPLNELLLILEAHKQQDGWTKDGGEFVPHAATWLSQERWDDDLVKQSTKAQAKLTEVTVWDM